MSEENYYIDIIAMAVRHFQSVALEGRVEEND